MSQIMPQGKQRDVLGLKTEGHSVVLGTAGSGKTTLAVFRAKYLANLFPKQKILLLTFNKALIAYLDDAYGALPRNVEVRNYHRFARGYLKGLNKMPDNCILSNKSIQQGYIEQAINDTKKQLGANSSLNRPIKVFIDEIKFIETFGVASLKEYEEMDRIGRSGTKIKRENRKYFFCVYKNYINIRINNKYLYDWNDIAYYALEELLNDERERFYSHIIVDEGQDFSPIMLKSLVNAIPQNGSFIFFGDVAQQIYGSRLTWRNAGFNIKSGEIWRFQNNYRNTAEIVTFAKALTKSKYWSNSDDLVEPISPKASGPIPTLVKILNSEVEKNWIVNTMVKEHNRSSNVIILKNRELVSEYKVALKAAGIDTQIIDRNMNSFNVGNGVSIGTFYSVKGIEFDNVFIPMLNASFFPNLEDSVEGNEDEVISDEMKLLYVAITRARRLLIMTYTEDLTFLFPNEKEIYGFAKVDEV